MDADKKILLLDLNGTLCYRTYDPVTKERSVVIRPFALEVITELSQHYTLGVVTSMKLPNAKYILYALSPKWKAYFKYVFDSTYCIPMPTDEDPYLLARDLNKIMGTLKCDKSNVIFVDNDVGKYLEEGYDVRVVSTFDATVENDTELLRIRDELL